MEPNNNNPNEATNNFENPNSTPQEISTSQETSAPQETSTPQTSAPTNTIASPTTKSKKKMKLETKIIIITVSAIIVFALSAFVIYDVVTNLRTPNSSSDSINMTAKPMIYLYPEETTEVSVQLGNPQLLTTTYPDYQNGWQVIAEPNGTLHNLDSTRDYYGLYWEGSGNHTSIHQDGFVIPGTETAKFLEEKLAILGLTDREANEFIIYWLPQLEKNPYNYIRFETKSEIDQYMPLNISPNPDSIIRIIMDYQPLNEPITVAEQQLATPERTGYTVVEWGGTKIGDTISH